MQAFDIKSPMGYDNLLCNGHQTAAVICLTEKASRLASYSLSVPAKAGKQKGVWQHPCSDLPHARGGIFTYCALSVLSLGCCQRSAADTGRG